MRDKKVSEGMQDWQKYNTLFQIYKEMHFMRATNTRKLEFHHIRPDIGIFIEFGFLPTSEQYRSNTATVTKFAEWI